MRQFSIGMYMHTYIAGADVMITIFSDFRQFFAEKIGVFFSKINVMIDFLQNLALFWVKNAIFGENIEKF
jgi:hypothetical protein